MPPPAIVQPTPATAAPLLPELVALLRDVVNHGGSASFLPPLGEAEATAARTALCEPL